MAVIGTEGFDYFYDAVNATTGSQAIWVKGFQDQQLCPGRFGGNALYHARAGGTELIKRTLDVPATTGNFTIGFAMAVTSLGVGPVVYVNDSSDGTAFTIAVETNGAISVRANSNGAIICQSAAGLIPVATMVDLLVTSGWKYVEVSTPLSSTGTVTINVDGAQVATGTGVTKLSTTTVSYLYLNEPNGGACILDDMYWSDDLVKLGPQRVEYKPPTADVGSAWTPSTGTNRYPCVSRRATQSANYVSATTVGQEQRFTFEKLRGSPAQVNAVSVLAFVSSSDGTGAITLTGKSGNTSAASPPITLLSTFKFKRWTLANDPNTGSKFTGTAVEAFEAGAKVTTASTSARLSQFGLEVLKPASSFSNDPGGHRYWRVHYINNEGQFRVGGHTVEFINQYGTRLEGKGFGNGYYGPTNAYQYASDDRSDTLYIASDTVITNDYIAWDCFGSFRPVILNHGAQNGFLTESPKDFTVDYSDDGTTWTVWYTAPSQPAWTSGETRSFTLATPLASNRRRTLILT